MAGNKVLIIVIATLFCIGCSGDENNEDNNGDVINSVSNTDNITVLKSANLNHQATTKRHFTTISQLESVTNEPNIELQKNMRKPDQYCFPKSQNIITASKHFKSDDVKRVVVYFYIVRDKIGNANEFMYIPDVNKQHQFPELPFQSYDLVILANHLAVKDVVNDNNPYIINQKEYSSVPDQRENTIVKHTKIDHFKNTLPTNCYNTDKGIICKNERGDVIRLVTTNKNKLEADKLIIDNTKESIVSDEEKYLNKPHYDKHKVYEDVLKKFQSIIKLSKLHKYSSTEPADDHHSEGNREDESNEFEKNNLDYDSYEQLKPKHHKVYDEWANFQISAKGNHFKKDPKLNIKLLKTDILRGLSDDGFIINKNGHITDSNGKSYNMANVKLIPIMNAKSASNNKNPRKQVKYVAVASQKPFRILTLIPIKNKHNKQETIPPPPFNKSDKEPESDDLDLDLPMKHKTRCYLKRKSCILCRNKRSNPYPYDTQNRAMPCPGCKFNENNEKKLTDILVRILGGSAAMSSGRPIRNKGKNNIVSDDMYEK